jgi:hypothetical protein
MATPYTEFRNDELASQTNVAAGSDTAAFRYRASFTAETAPDTSMQPEALRDAPCMRQH